MESHATLAHAEKEKKADLKRQIALLQAQVGDMPDSDPESEPSPKRPKLNHQVLAPATPSPKKKRPEKSHAPKSFNATSVTVKYPGDDFVPVKPAASNVLRNLANTRRAPLDAAVEVEPLARSAAFTDTPATAPEQVASVPRRDDRLAIIDNLEMGPMDHKAPFDDPLFKHLEPNSGIRLSSRVLAHEDLQDHLRGRYYLSPSRLYSAVRLLPDKQGYDVPVDGDWITIAVVAERGPYKSTKPPVTMTRDEEDESGKGKGKAKAKDTPKPSGKKYINMKLVDFGAPARSASSATGGKAVIRGDAMLSLLLFESDGFETIPQNEDRPKKVYRGGSRGAFEEMCDLKEGDVVVLLNPRILKPFQRAADAPHPTTNILAITPESASSILVIGRSKDLGLCVATKRDGKVCGSWCDKRLSDVCEWHVQNAVEQRRAGRSEFSSGTSGMATTARKQRKPGDEYDPRRKWGLQPVNQHDPNSGTTYVMSGHVVGGAESTSVADNIGREGQAKASRKRAAREEEKVLLKLLGRDKEGMREVLKAREVGQELAAGGKEKGGGKKGKEASTDPKGSEALPPTKNAFSAEIVKQLGFDPTLKPGQKRRPENPATRKKMDELTRLQNSRTEISLTNRRPPGERVRSGVIVPPALKKASATTMPTDSKMVCLDSDSDDEDLPFSVPLPDALQSKQ
ncbi:hypothetical protein FB45DRAFT_909809 [Roridomyces roridus]|uniref:Zinc finger Mcm10/DnaG-type domain-containing protein n=1 Tax=Roridomyces roridus TaxID=1738132 RepID=A0AAD7BZ90_9AGAR|nr:hypothetical protein FB45DRAFT_909809 [Roridomyces roridus]